MEGSALYHDGNRRLQDEFDSRRIADRLEAVNLRTAFSDRDRQFIESACFFFLATADQRGQPNVSHKGGMPGFVRVVGPAELAYPDYDGNGMFMSLGNVAVNPKVGLLFIDFERPRRLIVHADGALQPRRPADALDGRRPDDRPPAGHRHLSQLPALYPEDAAPRSVGIRPAPGRGPGRAGVEVVPRIQGCGPPAPEDA